MSEAPYSASYSSVAAQAADRVTILVSGPADNRLRLRTSDFGPLHCVLLKVSSEAPQTMVPAAPHSAGRAYSSAASSALRNRPVGRLSCSSHTHKQA